MKNEINMSPETFSHTQPEIATQNAALDQSAILNRQKHLKRTRTTFASRSNTETLSFSNRLSF